jgi:hypothetical protein
MLFGALETKLDERCLSMPAILLWLMGVPLIVIVLLYLIF